MILASDKYGFDTFMKYSISSFDKKMSTSEMSNVTLLEEAFQEAVKIGYDANKDNPNEDDESEYEVIEDDIDSWSGRI